MKRKDDSCVLCFALKRDERLVQKSSVSPPLCEILLAVTSGVFSDVTGKLGLLEADH